MSSKLEIKDIVVNQNLQELLNKRIFSVCIGTTIMNISYVEMVRLQKELKNVIDNIKQEVENNQDKDVKKHMYN